MSPSGAAGIAHDRGDMLVAFSLLLFAALLFLVNLGEPPLISFDEFWYVPAARDILHLQKDSNLEHPLFAKQVIGLGIWIFGDNAFGWRIFGALLGAAIPPCLFVISRYFGLTRTAAAFGAALTIFDQTLFVMARTAMLDIHGLGWLVISLTVLAWSAQARRTRAGALGGVAGSAILYGLACGSKWLAIFDGGLVWIGILAFVVAERRDPVRPRTIWPHLSILLVIALFGVVSVLVYFATFWPLLYLKEGRQDLLGIIETNLRIFRRSSSPLGPHAHQSDWWSWPVMIEPVWFYLSKPVDGVRQGVFYVGNMLIYWGGALAGLACIGLGTWKSARGGAVTGARGMLALGLCWLALWLVWAVVPKKIGFFYYYDSASLLLGPCLAAAVQALAPARLRVWIMAAAVAMAIAIFIYFYPILAASEIPTDGWRRFVLFPGWG